MSKSRVEFLMRHTCYIASSYYRNDCARKEFHRDESALYINKGRDDTKDDAVSELNKQLNYQAKGMDRMIAVMLKNKLDVSFEDIEYLFSYLLHHETFFFKSQFLLLCILFAIL